jgi:hypothetical protein
MEIFIISFIPFHSPKEISYEKLEPKKEKARAIV